MKTLNINHVSEFWKKRANLYEKIPIESIVIFKESKERDDKLKKTIIKYIDKTDKKVLDVGCGTGRISLYLASYVDFVLGIDYTKKLINIAEIEKNKRNIKNVVFKHEDSQTFNYNKKFDVVIICGLFNYLNDDAVDKTIKNISKHLKINGKVIVKETIALEKRYYIIEKYSEELKSDYNSIYRTTDELISLFEKNSFKVKICEKFYQHRKETAGWFFVFLYTGEKCSGKKLE